MCVCVCVCVSARARASVCACVRACFTHYSFMWACVCVTGNQSCIYSIYLYARSRAAPCGAKSLGRRNRRGLCHQRSIDAWMLVYSDMPIYAQVRFVSPALKCCMDAGVLRYAYIYDNHGSDNHGSLNILFLNCSIFVVWVQTAEVGSNRGQDSDVELFQLDAEVCCNIE